MKIGTLPFDIGSRTFVMGILNVTPDSFSDGGRFDEIESAVSRALEMERQGADIIDVGGESTRPGHTPVAPEEEIRRTSPVIGELVSRLRIPISIDTSKKDVAKAALEAGASLINDVWGFRRDPEMADLAAQAGIPVCLMHNQEGTRYENLMDDILRQLEESAIRAVRAGVNPAGIILDPGIGFGKTVEQNLEVMRNLERLGETGFPWLLGSSRKSMIGKTLKLPAHERTEGTIATNVLAITAGADFIRVHDVRENTLAARMTDRIIRFGRKKKNTVYLALGSNLGNRREYLRKAAVMMADIRSTEILDLSGIYETPPVGYTEQGKFLNAVAKLETALEPEKLLEELQGIEKSLKRERARKWGPRTIDLDILFFNNEILSTERLELPHPRLHERAFVLRPLNEIAPLLLHPGENRRVFELLETAGEGEEIEYVSDFLVN